MGCVAPGEEGSNASKWQMGFNLAFKGLITMDPFSRVQFGRLKLRVSVWNPNERYEYLCAIILWKTVLRII
jgi:hypothetical protein